MQTRLKYPALFILFLLIWTAGFSQTDSSLLKSIHDSVAVYDSVEIKHDSATNRLFNHIKQFGDSEQRKHLLIYSEDTIATKQNQTIELIKKLTLEAQSYLENGIDTTGLADELNRIKRWYEITSDGVFINTGSIQTHRNLETSFKIMRELLIRTNARKTSLDKYYKRLEGFRNTIDSLYKQDILYKFSSDSMVLMRYVERLTVVSQEIKPIDSSLKKTLVNISGLQPTINLLVNQLDASIEQIELFQQRLSTSAFKRTSNNIGGPLTYDRPFKEIINFSEIKAWLSFIFFTENEAGKIVLLLVIIIACTIFLLNLKRQARKDSMLNGDSSGQMVLRYPFLSAVFIVLNTCQFFFVDPPFIFSVMIWLISGLSMTFLLRDSIARYWLIVWTVLFILFVLACLDNLVLQATRFERWMMVVLAGVGVVFCSAVIAKGPRNQLKEKLLIWFLGFAVLLQIASILSNVYGRYNLSKTFLTAGFFNAVLVVLFYWTLQFIIRTLALTARVYNKPNRKLFVVNFDPANDKAPLIFYILLFAGWLFLFARNFYASKFVSGPIENFFLEKRTIGQFSYTIGSLFEFILILYVSGMISRTVAFFASGDTPTQDRTGRKRGLGSWLLIIRIFIISIGLWAALAAVGIPMDRLTIILSALSVGIGFGLQTLVNNLVSGLIILFEKPVSVGDIVEVGKQSGVVKSIGFRSSIITTPDGANVVIPNGNLLDQHLVNWTHENPSRAVSIELAVAYGTNLEEAMKILKALPIVDERILAHPEPTAIIRQFADNSIDIHLTFWVKNLNNSEAVKSDIYLAIDRAFKEHAIRIPFLQQT
jgi:small-conductance mechanosensitive channel